MKDDQLRLLFNNTSYFLGLLNPEGVVLKANKLLLDLINRVEGEVLGMHFWDCP